MDRTKAFVSDVVWYAVTLALYGLIVAFLWGSAGLTVKLTTQMYQEPIWSVSGVIAVSFEIFKFTSVAYFLRLVAERLSLKTMLVGACGAAVTVISMFASLSHQKGTQEHLDKSSIESSYEYQRLQGFIADSDKEIAGLQVSLNNFNSTKKVVDEKDASWESRATLNAARKAQADIKEARAKRDNYFAQLKAIKPTSAQRSALSALGLEVDSDGIAVLTVIMIELCPFALSIIIDERRKRREQSQRVFFSAPGSAPNDNPRTTPEDKKRSQKPEAEPQNHSHRPHLSIVKDAPGSTSDAPTANFLDQSSSGSAPGKAFTDKEFDRILGALYNRECRPSYREVQKYLHCHNDDLHGLFQDLRGEGIIEMHKNKHVLNPHYVYVKGKRRRAAV